MNWLVDLTEARWNGNFVKYFGRLLEFFFKSDWKSDKIGIITKKSDYLRKKVTKSDQWKKKSDKKWKKWLGGNPGDQY